MGLDSDVAPPTSDCIRSGSYTWNWVHVTLTATYSSVPSAGKHSFIIFHKSNNVGTTYWRGDEGNNTLFLPGAIGHVMG